MLCTITCTMSHLTSLVGGDGDSGVLPHLGCRRWNPVLRLDLKCVVCVSEQVAHRHRGVVEARGSGQESNVATTRLAAHGPAVAAVGRDSTAAFAEDGEGDVPAAAGVLWPAPVQDDRRLVDGGDHVTRSWRRDLVDKRRGGHVVRGSWENEMVIWCIGGESGIGWEGRRVDSRTIERLLENTKVVYILDLHWKMCPTEYCTMFTSSPVILVWLW